MFNHIGVIGVDGVSGVLEDVIGVNLRLAEDLGDLFFPIFARSKVGWLIVFSGEFLSSLCVNFFITLVFEGVFFC